jgi:ATP-binding cassette subfamily B protein
MIIIIYWGGKDVIAGNITIGNIGEFIFYLNQLTWPVAALGYTTSMIQRAEASQRRINEFLKTKTNIISERNIEKEIKGNIEFKNVDFIYPDSGIAALKNISFSVKEGHSIAIVGTTGSGKSTIANLLCRMYDPGKGQIQIDGIDIKDYSISSLRSQIGYVPQDVFLFSDTIQNNIAFGSENVSDKDVIQAAKDADLYDNIEGFPDKFETILGERGITLSGGQKQRLSIARAIIREPKILILDDVLSAVDTKTENAILENMQRIMKGRTSVIISHRVSSVKLADYILVLEDGNIIEKGTHQELMNHNGAYKSLYQKQLSEENLVGNKQ